MEKTEKEKQLLENLFNNLDNLKSLLLKIDNGKVYEEKIYRFYHQSFKVYFLQETTKEIVKALKGLAPVGVDINPYFKEILKDGNVGNFKLEHNKNWTQTTRPILEAFFHAKYFLEMACKSAKIIQKNEAPQILPYCYASFLYFYNLR